MKIILFTHPPFITSMSMPKYANWLRKGMEKREFEVEEWTASPVFSDYKVSTTLKKWLGYIDQYIIFPKWVKRKLKEQDPNILYVFTDHALGPWVPLVKGYKHVIHCHDFLAQKSALGLIPENLTGRTGKIYQNYIRRGYRRGMNFIAISKKTKADLLAFLEYPKDRRVEVVYNGLNQPFLPNNDLHGIRIQLSQNTGIALENGYLLHVGGNQWYKNRLGVVRLYDAWRLQTKENLPLLLIGPQPNNILRNEWDASKYREDIHFLTDKPDEFVRQVYAGASLFLFPSLAEGFGWPIAEAMASGCLVLTTDEAPMTEVGGDAAFYFSRMPRSNEERSRWEKKVAELIDKVLTLSETEKGDCISKGLEQVKLFDSNQALDRIATIYREIINKP